MLAQPGQPKELIQLKPGLVGQVRYLAGSNLRHKAVMSVWLEGDYVLMGTQRERKRINVISPRSWRPPSSASSSRQDASPCRASASVGWQKQLRLQRGRSDDISLPSSVEEGLCCSL